MWLKEVVSGCSNSGLPLVPGTRSQHSGQRDKGYRMSKHLKKMTHKVHKGHSSHRQQKRQVSRLRTSVVLSRLMLLSTNLVPFASTALLISGLSNWMSVVLIPLTLPCRYLSHGRQCPTLHIPSSESAVHPAVEEPARAKREANKKASSNALEGLDQAPAKAATGSLQKHL